MFETLENSILVLLFFSVTIFVHEMGHFLATVRYRIPASLPFFLPLPISPIGTIGAVIGMDGKRANRKETFDIVGHEDANADTVEVTATPEDGEPIRFKAQVRIDTPKERDYYENGGILHYVLRQLAA